MIIWNDKDNPINEMKLSQLLNARDYRIALQTMKSARAELNWSQGQLCLALQLTRYPMSQQYLSKLEKDERDCVTLGLYKEICVILQSYEMNEIITDIMEDIADQCNRALRNGRREE